MNQSRHQPSAAPDSSEPHWDLWRSFLAVHAHGSLSAAARALKLTQPSVGRHIQELEQTLAVALFTRSRHGLQPTPLANALAAQAQTMAHAAESLLRTASAQSGEEQGTVRISASETVGSMILPALLTSFREKHPAIAVELALSNRNDDLLEREADIAVRMQRPAQAALVARRLGSIQVGLFAHASYARKHGLPTDVQSLLAHPLIGVDRDEAPLQHPGLQAFGLSRHSFALRCDSDVAQLMALRAGFGIGACHLVLAASDPELVRVLPHEVQWHYEMWLAMHEDQRSCRRIRLLFDHLAQTLGKYLQTPATAA